MKNEALEILNQIIYAEFCEYSEHMDEYDKKTPIKRFSELSGKPERKSPIVMLFKGFYNGYVKGLEMSEKLKQITDETK